MNQKAFRDMSRAELEAILSAARPSLDRLNMVGAPTGMIDYLAIQNANAASHEMQRRSRVGP